MSVARALVVSLLAGAIVAGSIGNAAAQGADPPFSALAARGVAEAQRGWADEHDHWYYERLADHDRYPQATIWGAVPLFEALSGVAIASPTSANRAAVDRFGRGAQRYFDPALRPRGGYAPYPGDRGAVRAYFDDNGWWGLAFLDAFTATRTHRYLRDAQRAFDYSLNAGWDRARGGLWWNTSHPYKAGEALAANALLGARLYAITGAARDRARVHELLWWADVNLWNPDDSLHGRSDRDSTPMPYEEGPIVLAYRTLCEAESNGSLCDRAASLAQRCYERFPTLSMGPQYDVIYFRTMLAYGRLASDRRWEALARDQARRALANAGTGHGLFLRAWDGGDMRDHQARPGMLRTHAATVELFAWLAAT